jgi:cleavage stimulation factor subunit 3
LYSRVIYVYKQAVMNMRFYPNIFYDAAEYAKSHSQDAESLEFIRIGMAANKLSFLLHYAYAEVQEESHTLSEVRTTYETLIANLTQEYEKMVKMAEFMRLQLDGDEEADAAGVGEASEAEREAIMERRRRRKVQREMIEREHEMRIEGIANENTNAWIGLMQATRRAEGIKSARLVFGKARKAKFISHHIFVASGISGPSVVMGTNTCSVDGVSRE